MWRPFARPEELGASGSERRAILRPGLVRGSGGVAFDGH
jgi:hypothetical protein